MGTKWTENKSSLGIVNKWFNNYKLKVRSTENFICLCLLIAIPFFITIFSGNMIINDEKIPYKLAILDKETYMTERLNAQAKEIEGQVTKKLPVLEKFREVEKFNDDEDKILEDIQGVGDIGVIIFDTKKKVVYSNKSWIKDLLVPFKSSKEILDALGEEKEENIFARMAYDNANNVKSSNGFEKIYFTPSKIYESEIRAIDMVAVLSGICILIIIIILSKKIMMFKNMGLKLYRDSLRWGYLSKIKNAVYTLLKRNIMFDEVLKDSVVWIIIGFGVLALALIFVFESIALDNMIRIEVQMLKLLVIFAIPAALLLHFVIKILYRYEGIEFVTTNLKSIEMGNFDIEVRFDDDHQIRKLSKGINDIRIGYKTAIEEGLTSEKMKTELISNVSHDLKTPLTSIINYVNIIQREDITEDERAAYIDILDEKSTRLKDLIEDLFEVSKMNSGKITLDKHDIDIVQLLHQCIAELDDYNTEKNMEFKIKGIEEGIIQMDGMRMSRVFQNLGTNALKYGLDNTRVYINVQDIGSDILISFKNISEYELDFDSDDIVERFYRGDKSRNSGVEGSGLGLAITKSIVELHEGVFKVECEGDLFKAYVKIPK
ncbi:cell wall metabolism sensor histidine kinase WalK [uncultured Clostridium sp.]|uniref:sensor histidine kinase n=1 Tax=uncultured Clostridium sp. TaxID=59620 RepID=UPI002607795E|nr:HAMP domain-containing sensor histidine kinase [uncultured Clostridium sp.]